MPDFHQPDEEDRRAVEARVRPEETVGDWAERVPLQSLRVHAEELGIEGAADMTREELVDALRRERPSSSKDPNAPGRPRT